MSLFCDSVVGVRIATKTHPVRVVNFRNFCFEADETNCMILQIGTFKRHNAVTVACHVS